MSLNQDIGVVMSIVFLPPRNTMHEYEIITGLPKDLLKIVEGYCDPVWSEHRRAKYVDGIDHAYPVDNRMFIVGRSLRYGCPYFTFSGDFGESIAKRFRRGTHEVCMYSLRRRRYRVVWIGDNLVVAVVKCSITGVETLRAFGFNGSQLWSCRLSIFETPIRGYIYIEEGKTDIWYVDRKGRICSIHPSTPGEGVKMPPIEGIRSFAVGPTIVYVMTTKLLLLLSRETKTMIDSFPLEGESHRLILTKQHLYRWFFHDGTCVLEVRSLDGTLCYQQQVGGSVIHVDDQRIILDMGTRLVECVRKGRLSVSLPKPKERGGCVPISRLVRWFS